MDQNKEEISGWQIVIAPRRVFYFLVILYALFISTSLLIFRAGIIFFFLTLILFGIWRDVTIYSKPTDAKK